MLTYERLDAVSVRPRFVIDRLVRLLQSRKPQTSLFSAVVRAASLAAVGILLAAFALQWWVTRGKAGDGLTGSQQTQVALDVVKVAGAVVAGLGAAIALTVSYRRQREDENRRDGERFELASRQLGDADAAVRIAGAYALARLADESEEFRPQTVQLLCAYLRLNRSSDDAVQQTVCEILASRLSSRENSPGPWSHLSIDLHGVEFVEDVNFSMCHFLGRTRFDKAVFAGDATFVNAAFGEQVLFSDSRFRGLAYFFYSQFRGSALFNGAEFDTHAAFNSAKFSGGLQMNGARFGQGVSFSSASFINGATFSDAELGSVSFDKCSFRLDAATDRGTVHRGATYFRGSRIESGWFENARFEAPVLFDGIAMAEYHFDGVSILGPCSAMNAGFGPAGVPPVVTKALKANPLPKGFRSS